MTILPFFLTLGAFVGLCAGLLGIGGGLILVPGLYYLFQYIGVDGQDKDILIHTALATSMAIILPTGLSSSWAQIKRQAVDWNFVKLLTPGLVVGVIIGIILVPEIKSDILKVIFAIGLTVIALSMILKKETSSVFPLLQKQFMALPFSMVFGILATFLGIGGAVLNVPYMNRAGLPLKTAIATGSVLGVVISFIATIGYLISGHGTFGYINMMAFLMIVPASVMMAPVGVKLSHAIPVKKLKMIFSSLLIVLAIKMIFETL